MPLLERCCRLYQAPCVEYMGYTVCLGQSAKFKCSKTMQVEQRRFETGASTNLTAAAAAAARHGHEPIFCSLGSSKRVGEFLPLSPVGTRSRCFIRATI